LTSTLASTLAGAVVYAGALEAADYKFLRKSNSYLISTPIDAQDLKALIIECGTESSVAIPVSKERAVIF